MQPAQKEDFLLAVDQSQTERNIADYERMKMDNAEVIDQEENDSFEKKHSMLKEIAVFGLIVLIVAAAVLIFWQSLCGIFSAFIISGVRK